MNEKDVTSLHTQVNFQTRHTRPIFYYLFLFLRWFIWQRRNWNTVVLWHIARSHAVVPGWHAIVHAAWGHAAWRHVTGHAARHVGRHAAWRHGSRHGTWWHVGWHAAHHARHTTTMWHAIWHAVRHIVGHVAHTWVMHTWPLHHVSTTHRSLVRDHVPHPMVGMMGIVRAIAGATVRNSHHGERQRWCLTACVLCFTAHRGWDALCGSRMTCQTNTSCAANVVEVMRQPDICFKKSRTNMLHLNLLFRCFTKSGQSKRPDSCLYNW